MREVAVGDAIVISTVYTGADRTPRLFRKSADNEVTFTFECLAIENTYSTWSVRYAIGPKRRPVQIGQTSLSFDHIKYTTLGLLRLALDALDHGVFTDDEGSSASVARGQHRAHEALPREAWDSEPDH